MRSVTTEALFDTGAVRSLVPPKILAKLGLGIYSQRFAKFADGRRESVGVSEGMYFPLEGRETLEEALVTGDQVLIGQTVLEKIDMLADCKRQKLVGVHGEEELSMLVSVN